MATPDMYEIMKQLVRCAATRLISVDHASHGVPEFGEMAGAYGYSTGYMKRTSVCGRAGSEARSLINNPTRYTRNL